MNWSNARFQATAPKNRSTAAVSAIASTPDQAKGGKQREGNGHQHDADRDERQLAQGDERITHANGEQGEERNN